MSTNQITKRMIMFYFNHGENYKCMELLDSYLETNNDMNAIVMMCELFIREEKYDVAEKILKEIINSNIANGRVYYIYGNIAKSKKDYSRSLEQYEMAMRRGYVSISLLDNYVKVISELGNDISQFELLDRYKDYMDEDIVRKTKGDLFFAKNKFNDAYKAYVAAGNIAQENLFMLAYSYILHDDYSNAVLVLDSIINNENKDSLYYDSLYVRATIRKIVDGNDGELDRIADIILEDISELKDEFAVFHAYFILSRCYVELKKYAEINRILTDFVDVVGVNDFSKLFISLVLKNIRVEDGIQEMESLSDALESEDSKMRLELFLNYLKVKISDTTDE